MAKKTKAKSKDTVIPLNVKYNLKDSDPKMAAIAQLLDKGFDLGLLSPDNGTILIKQKNHIATIALSRLLADLEKAKAKSSDAPARAGARADIAESDNTVGEEVAASPKKRGLTDLNKLMTKS